MSNKEFQAEQERRQRLAWINRILLFCCDSSLVEERRLSAISRMEEMTQHQKSCAKQQDYESAKFFKHEAGEAMKEYRGACLLLGYLLCNPPGDSLYRRIEDWPPEIVPYAARMSY